MVKAAEDKLAVSSKSDENRAAVFVQMWSLSNRTGLVAHCCISGLEMQTAEDPNPTLVVVS